MSSHDDIHSGEMTDTRLDQLLAAANRELLDHVEATADSHRALGRISVSHLRFGRRHHGENRKKNAGGPIPSDHRR